MLPIWGTIQAAEYWNSVNFFEATLLISGLFIGPSLGQFYAGAPGSADLGILGRVTAGIIFLLEGGIKGKGEGPSLVYALATLYSLIDTPIEIQRHNEKVKAQHFGFSPELFPSSNGGLKPGVMAWAKF